MILPTQPLLKGRFVGYDRGYDNVSPSTSVHPSLPCLHSLAISAGLFTIVAMERCGSVTTHVWTQIAFRSELFVNHKDLVNLSGAV